MAAGNRRAVLVLAFLAAAATPAAAVNEMFAKDAPIARMTEDDLRIASAVIREALDNGKQDQAYEWKNEATSASGSITPVKTFTRAGMTCRGANFVIAAGGRISRTSWNLCKTPDGWKVAEGR
jgi:surface antigen